MGGGWIMTEFGAAEDKKGDLYALEHAMKIADKYAQSWMYWQFKYYQDITTCTPEGESLYQGDGTVCLHKLKILSRTYPQATAGTLGPYSFDPLTGHFAMGWTQLPSSSIANDVTKADVARTTVLYINRELFYSHGANVLITNNVDGSVVDNMTVQCSHLTNAIQLTQSSLGGGDVTVVVSACHVGSDSCNCR